MYLWYKNITTKIAVVFVQTLHMEHLRKKEQKVRQRLEDRDHARKLASERWKIGKW